MPTPTSKGFVPNSRQNIVDTLMSIEAARQELGHLTCKGDECFKSDGSPVPDRELMNALFFHKYEWTESQRQELLKDMFAN